MWPPSGLSGSVRCTQSHAHNPGPGPIERRPIWTRMWSSTRLHDKTRHVTTDYDATEYDATEYDTTRRASFAKLRYKAQTAKNDACRGGDWNPARMIRCRRITTASMVFAPTRRITVRLESQCISFSIFCHISPDAAVCAPDARHALPMESPRHDVTSTHGLRRAASRCGSFSVFAKR